MKTKSLCIQAPVYSSDLKALYKSVIIIFYIIIIIKQQDRLTVLM